MVGEIGLSVGRVIAHVYLYPRTSYHVSATYREHLAYTCLPSENILCVGVTSLFLCLSNFRLLLGDFATYDDSLLASGCEAELRGHQEHMYLRLQDLEARECGHAHGRSAEEEIYRGRIDESLEEVVIFVDGRILRRQSSRRSTRDI